MAIKKHIIKSRIRDLETKLDLFWDSSDRKHESVQLAKRYERELEELYAKLKG